MIFTIGVSVLGIGAAMILLPGPAILVVPAGLAILALEFGWARRLLRRMREESATLWRGQASAHERDDSRENEPPDPAG